MSKMPFLIGSIDPILSFSETSLEIGIAFLRSGITAGAVGGVVALLGNKWIKSHDDRIEMSTRKMDLCLKYLPLYGNIMAHLSGLSIQLSKKVKNDPKFDEELSLYYISNILRARYIIYQGLGGLILDTLEGEQIMPISFDFSMIA